MTVGAPMLSPRPLRRVPRLPPIPEPVEKAELGGVATMRRLSRLAFANASMEDTVHALPVKATAEGDAGHEEAIALRAFASSEGSLSKLNFLGGIGGADETSDALVDDNDTALMIRMVTRKGKSVHGAYPSHINHAVHLLQYTLQSQACGSATRTSDDHGAGLHRKPVARQDIKPETKVHRTNTGAHTIADSLW
ncbi:hypothetical protein Esi_0605_0011 [Ectocarpus siliculosus]|uniref:Uncharacterized protein n=1 Tax=Ectocarpus siliculosus TaxID=2880 RepID=D7G514_ECTSI|nr:hypothetical protein Esi_0605_0011 [Ectocarpus siliculosus]|eukprot:CBJ33777.1 hypothetical protein Esi_0605_0011 [Ectocarpus siliculosus]